MFIVWGEQKKIKKLGFAADFCPMCRDVRCFKMQRVGMASHVYYLSFGAGKLLGHLAVCESCAHRMEVDETQYQSLVKRPALDLASLEEETFPDLRSVHAERIALEQTLENSPGELSREQREALIREPFANLAPIVEERYASSAHIDLYSLLSLLVMFCLPTILAVMSSNSSDPSTKQALGYAALVLFGACAIITGFFLFSEAKRYVRTKILPKLAKALGKLKPSREELEDCLVQLRTLGMKLAKKVKVDELVHQIELVQDEAGGI